MSYTYLASPYSHPDAAVREARYDAALACLAHMLKIRVWTYSPIVHCHRLSIEVGLPGDHEFWRDYDRAMIQSAQNFAVLAVDGWRESRGVTEELEFVADTLPVTWVVRRADGTYRFDKEKPR